MIIYACRLLCFFNDTSTTEIYTYWHTLSQHDAVPISPDVDREARVFESRSRSYYGDNPDNVRRALLNGTVKATDAKARFVGRDAYVGAGGRIERDMFGEDVDES